MQYQSFRVAFLTLLVSAALDAQWSDRLYPFRELTDEMRARIDLKDGTVEDWSEVLGEPTLTPLDFATPPSYPEYDPSSFDFRIWLAWHDAGNHLFVAAEIVDDTYVGDHPDRPAHIPPWEAVVHFSVDGDGSGGTTVETGVDNVVIRDITMGQAQEYWAVAENHGNSIDIFLNWVSIDSPWVHQVPYAGGGGRVLDSQPVFYVIEFYVTAFDRLIWDSPERSLVSELFPGKRLEFAMTMKDADTDPSTTDRSHRLLGSDASWESLAWWTSDRWAHGILLGADGGTGGTAIERTTWARIKASLSE